MNIHGYKNSAKVMTRTIKHLEDLIYDEQHDKHPDKEAIKRWEETIPKIEKAKHKCLDKISDIRADRSKKGKRVYRKIKKTR